MENINLLHLDLSYNHFGQNDIKAIGDGLKENHTLLGIHMQGNRANVDLLGFVEPSQKTANQDTGQMLTMHTFSRIPGKWCLTLVVPNILTILFSFYTEVAQVFNRRNTIFIRSGYGKSTF